MYHIDSFQPFIGVNVNYKKYLSFLRVKNKFRKKIARCPCMYFNTQHYKLSDRNISEFPNGSILTIYQGYEENNLKQYNFNLNGSFKPHFYRLNV